MGGDQLATNCMNAVDTNILVYSLVNDGSAKSKLASDLLDRLSAADTLLLWQVLCELGAVLSRLRSKGLSIENIQETLKGFRERFRLAIPDDVVLDLGWKLHLESRVSYWDAMLIAACVNAGADVLYTEDVQSAPEISGVRIVNPFTATNL